MLREGMFIADRYEILEKIGSGGMSDVYKAKCHKLNRYVAVKVLKPEFCEDKTFVAKFRAEAQSAAGLMHSNIVNVYDVGEENGIYYIIMELVEGITLKKYIEKKGRLGVREAVSVAIQVAQGIEAAHNHHVIHRDIKPQNIIISREGKVKVTDFGIARAASSNTINSSVMGSVHYVSPEQARGGYSDEKSDIYSFGITLFEMLTGRVPFEGDTTVAVALQHIQDDMISPRQFLEEIPVSVEKIVLKCTQKRTDRRYQSMTELIADLKRSLVTPDEDFVIIASAVPNGATQKISQEELAEINQRAAVKNTGPALISPEHGDAYAGRMDDASEGEEELYEAEENEEEVVDDLYEEETDTSAKKIDKVITILGIAVGVVILVITIIVIVKMVKLFSGDSQSNKKDPVQNESDDGRVEVPSLLGKTFEDAKKELNDLGLGIKLTEDYSDLQEEGLIFAQSVDSGERVDKNTTIIVTVSKGVLTFDMPDVSGKTRTEAESELRGKGLEVQFATETTDDESLVNTVKGTDPEAGTTVKSGDVVKIIIYIGSEVKTAEVIDVTGYTKDEATKKLNDAGFTLITYEYEYSDDVEEGKVINLTGAEIGDKVDVDRTQIILLISNGKQDKGSAVPTVTGKSKDDAIKALNDAGFKNVTVEEEYNSDVAAGKVISISGVKEGENADEKTAIILKISLGEKPTEPETEKPAAELSISASVKADEIAGVITDDSAASYKIQFTYVYTDSKGNAKEHLASTVTVMSMDKIKEHGDYIVEVFKSSDIDKSKGATVKVSITWDGGEAQTVVGAEIK